MPVINGTPNNDPDLQGTVDVDDTINGLGGSDTIAGGLGDPSDRDVLNGGGGDDRLTAGGNDVLNGGLGNDRLFNTFTTGDRANGGAGNDFFEGPFEGGTINGGAGFDILNYRAPAALFDFPMEFVMAAPGATTAVKYNGTTALVFSGIEEVQISGSGFSDLILTGAGGDSVLSGQGDDTVNGGAGNDSLFAGDGLDQVSGGTGNDVLSGGADGASDTIDGGGGTDIVVYESLFESVFDPMVLSLANPASNTGAAAGDSYAGVEGLAGGTGGDTISGNGQANLLFDGGVAFDENGKVTGFGDLVGDSLSGLGGNDSLFSGLVGPETVNGGAGRDTLFVDEGTTLDLLNPDNAFTLASIEVISSLNVFGSLSLSGNNAANTFIGSLGEDRLLMGDGGNDTINGRGGGDFIQGGRGADRLTGGTAAGQFGATEDIFFYDNKLEGGDTITDFQKNIDTIQIRTDGFSTGGVRPTKIVIDDAPAGANNRPVFLYDTDDGRLIFDANGNTAGGRTTLATLTGGPDLTQGDFLLF